MEILHKENQQLYSDVPPTKLRNKDEKFRKAQNIPFWMWVADMFFYNMLENRFFSLKIKNEENYNKRNPDFSNIIYAPHNNWWDGIVGYNLCRRVFKTKIRMMIEEMNNAVKIDAMMRQAEYEFAELVAKIHENRQKNELVERTKNYIFQNLHSEIIIGEVGKEIGVNSSYLSDLFHKVEGITIQQFIRREKVRLAENMLRYSEYDVKDIANYLSFCSQSYFGSVFKDQTGMSPAKYRKMYGQWKKQNKL